MTSGPCHFSSLHSHFADCLVPELPLPINLHHSPSVTSASWRLSHPLRCFLSLSLSLPSSLFVSLSRRRLSVSPSFSVSLFSSPVLSHAVILSYPHPLVNRYEPKSHCVSAAREHIFQSACLHTAHIVMRRVICGALKGGNDSKLDTETWLLILGGFRLGGWVH